MEILRKLVNEFLRLNRRNKAIVCFAFAAAVVIAIELIR